MVVPGQLKVSLLVSVSVKYNVPSQLFPPRDSQESPLPVFPSSKLVNLSVLKATLSNHQQILLHTRGQVYHRELASVEARGPDYQQV